MSSNHLSIGSQDPPKVDGLLRLYSMLYCPYAQRVRLVLKAKQIPHDVVNVNLFNKPEWYFTIHPEGKVPALIDGSKVVVESIDISEYLNEKYPDHPLYPAEPEVRAKDKELVQKIGAVTKVYEECCFKNKANTKTIEEWLNSFLEVLQVFEDALEKKGTMLFGGDKPGMVDYMLWPWAERAPHVGIVLGQKLPLKDNQLPLICKWRKSMMEDPVCSELYIDPVKSWKIVEYKLKGLEAPYDEEL